MISHPQRHPTSVTFGLTAQEVAAIRFATGHSLLRYLFGYSRFYKVVTGAVLFVLLSGAAQIHSAGEVWTVFLRRYPLLIPFCLLYVVIRSCDWRARRTLGVKLGYGAGVH